MGYDGLLSIYLRYLRFQYKRPRALKTASVRNAHIGHFCLTKETLTKIESIW